MPELAVISPEPLSLQQVAAIGAQRGVRAVLAVDGGRVTIGGRTASVLGVSPEAFHAWTPPVAAADGAAWSALASGQLVASDTAVSGLGLVDGEAYEVSGTSSAQLVFRTSVLLGIPGVHAIHLGSVGDRRVR